jgi:hypothetical protein
MFLLFRNRRLEPIETAERERAQSVSEWAVEALVFGNGQRLGPLRSLPVSIAVDRQIAKQTLLGVRVA